MAGGPPRAAGAVRGPVVINQERLVDGKCDGEEAAFLAVINSQTVPKTTGPVVSDGPVCLEPAQSLDGQSRSSGAVLNINGFYCREHGDGPACQWSVRLWEH